jgi:hypothetical protein
MTINVDKGPALIGDLERDADDLAHNEEASEEQLDSRTECFILAAPTPVAGK